MRLIDADALIDAIDFCVVKGMGSTIAFTFKHIVDSIPTIEAEHEWIPCSERLPDEKVRPMDCMVTRYSEQIAAYVDMAVCERDGTWTHEDWDAIVLGDVESGRKTGLMNTHGHPILAWMPLPTPYKGGDDK